MERTSMDELVQAPGAELEALKNAIRQEMHCALPAVVESYDKATQTVTVKPAIREQLSGGAYVELPLLSDVPVFFPGGAASGITFPVQKGDECLVVFSDSCIDAWYQYGGTQNPVSLRRHDLSDGFAFIGFRSKKNALPSVSDTPSFFGAKAGQDGKDGKDGASAYELAVSAGFEGNETEWLKSLHGKDGQDGAQGPQGERGPAGPQGPQGEQGPAGIADVSGIAPDENGHVELSANDVGALPAGGTAKDAEKLGGKAPAYYLQPRNLLDNSDFRNPINQRGQSSYTGIGYTIDRWRTWDENAAVMLHAGEGITLSKILYQYFEPGKLHTGDIYTVAICLGDGTICCASGALSTTGFSYFVGGVLALLQQEESGAVFMALQAAGGETVRWAAAYEGEYSASSLPPYVPKGYTQELMECRRYYVKYGDEGQYSYSYTNGYISGFVFAAPMRIVPTIISAAALKLSDFSTVAVGNLHSITANGIAYLNIPTAVSGEWYRLTGLELSADL